MQIIAGDCLTYSIDAIVTDPPAGISFMGREWDKDKGGRDHWIAWMQQVAAECLRCIKPGGHALVWALPRTSHWTATAWENAGWEVRDIVHHVFGSGFPKSLDVSKAIDKHLGAKGHQSKRFNVAGQGIGLNPCRELRSDNPAYMPYDSATSEAQQFAGWGTALKPACENWILLRKPLIGTVAQNVLQHGTGALNIDASRVPTNEMLTNHSRSGESAISKGIYADQMTYQTAGQSVGRWPSNLLHGSEEVVECFPVVKPSL